MTNVISTQTDRTVLQGAEARVVSRFGNGSVHSAQIETPKYQKQGRDTRTGRNLSRVRRLVAVSTPVQTELTGDQTNFGSAVAISKIKRMRKLVAVSTPVQTELSGDQIHCSSKVAARKSRHSKRSVSNSSSSDSSSASQRRSSSQSPSNSDGD